MTASRCQSVNAAGVFVKSGIADVALKGRANTDCPKCYDRAYQLVSRQAPMESINTVETTDHNHNGTVAYQIRGSFGGGGGPGDRCYLIVSGQG